MFIKLTIAEPFGHDPEPPTFYETYVDAGRIGFIREDDKTTCASFVIFDGDSGRRYLVQDMSAVALVEEVILARLNPSSCIPPAPNVGMDEQANINSLHWKANPQQPRKNPRK